MAHGPQFFDPWFNDLNKSIKNNESIQNKTQTESNCQVRGRTSEGIPDQLNFLSSSVLK